MVRTSSRYAFLPIALFLLCFSCLAEAQGFIFFPTDTTVNYTVYGYAIVGYANQNDFQNSTNGTSPTVSVVMGSSISNLNAHNNSQVTVSGGSVSGSLFAEDNSHITISTNIGNYVTADGSSTIDFMSGDVTYMYANNNSTVNISGGNIFRFFASDASTINLYGTGLRGTLTDPSFNGFSAYALSGTLSDGTSLTTNNILFVQNGSRVRVNFISANAVPEPGITTLLIGMAGVGMFVRNRRKEFVDDVN